MNISVVGSGYVGLCTAVGFASLDNKVIGVDLDQKKVDMINNGEPPIFENNLEDMLEKVLKKNMYNATTDLREAIMQTDVTFICVGTPSEDDGSIDLIYIEKASESVGKILKNKNSFHIVVVKSTVVPQTTEKVVLPILEKASGKKEGIDFGICMNPEFLREGNALGDFLYPDRIVIGALNERTFKTMENLYKNFNAPILRVNPRTAEMIKYAANAMLASKISLINEMGNFCKMIDIDVYDVAKGMGLDKRIGPHFLSAGVGFGGSCFKKDVMALVAESVKRGHNPKILKKVIDVNEDQPFKIIEILNKRMDIEGKRIAILGLSFKAETDDIRESPAIKIINKLLELGAHISAYDPKAMENMKQLFPDIDYFNSVETALKNSDACLILTDWKEFKSLDSEFDVMKNKIIIEGRKVLDPKKVDFEGVCW